VPPLPDAVTDVVELLRGETLLVAVVAFLGISAGVVLYLAVRQQPPGLKLRSVLGEHDAIAVLMHPNPDPDAMACALGVGAIANSAGTETTIQYPGQIRHQENRAFKTVLDLDFESIDSAAGLAEEAVVLVDHNQARGFAGADAVMPEAVVDHHPGDGTGESFTDVRPDYGACASVVAEYFMEHGAEPPPESNGQDHDPGEGGLWLTSEFATGLLYGILADTNTLTRGCSEADFAASAYLCSAIDEDCLDRIANPEVDSEVLDVKARAITDREVNNPFAVSNVGEISNVDAIPQAADELLGLEGVSAVVVFGENDDELYISGRSRDDRVHMGDTLSTAVEDVAMASAGGHARMGGGQVSIADHGEELGLADGLSEAELTDRLFEAMAGER